MTIDERITELLKEAIPPAEPPPGLATDLVARATGTGDAGGGNTGGGGATGGGGMGLLLPVAIAIAGGALVGAALGLFGGGGGQTAEGAGITIGPDAVPVYECPGEGQIGSLLRGDRVLIIGRSGRWVAVRNVRNANERVFVDSAYVTPDDDISDLPEMSCDDSGTMTVAGDTSTTTSPTTTTTTSTSTTTVPATTSTTTSPTTSTTTSPTTSTTSTTTTSTTSSTTTTTSTTSSTTTTTSTTSSTTTTTAPPDTTPPSISQQQADPDRIWEEDGLGISCPAGTPRQSTISATVTDDVGVASVTASWTDPSGARSVTMSASGNVYTTTFGPYPAGTWDPLSLPPYDNPVTITITAQDTAGNTSSTTVSVTVTEIGDCFG